MTKVQTLAWALLTAAGGGVGVILGFALANAVK
jgi:hypothetical protein